MNCLKIINKNYDSEHATLGSKTYEIELATMKTSKRSNCERQINH